jgi:hypothetical protein
VTSAAPTLEDALYALAEAGGNDVTLAELVGHYPQFADELLDLAQELRAIEADAAAPFTPDEAWESESWARFAEATGVTAALAADVDPFANLSSARQVEIRQALGVPSMVLNAFRDRQVDADSVPRPFFRQLAQLLSVAIEELKACLALPERLSPVMQYKADNNPGAASAKVAFADLLEQAMVPAERRATLLRDED